MNLAGNTPSNRPEADAGSQSSTPRSLADMPGPWLLQLVDMGWGEQRLVLFQSCRAMRDLVLSRCTLEAVFQLPIHPDTATAAQAKLVLACQRSSCVKLTLHYSDGVRLPVQQAADAIDADAAILLLSAMTALPAEHNGLSSVRSMVLVRLPLKALVPPWLTSTCPNMEALLLEDCVISTLPRDTSIPVCSQLKHLTFDGDTGPQAPWQHDWQHQFRALTGLKSISVVSYHSDYQPPRSLVTNAFLQSCAQLGTQLTQLNLEVLFRFSLPLSDLQQLTAWFPNLTSLCLTSTFISDGGMEAVLSLRHLTRFGCKGFSLQRSYSQRPCSWTHLAFKKLHTTSFDRLPLAGVRTLEAERGLLNVYPCADLDTINRVAAAIASCGGIAHKAPDGDTRGWHPSWRLVLDNRQAALDSTRLEACLALLPCCHELRVFDLYSINPITPALLATIKQHLPSTVRDIEVYTSSFAPEALPLLLPSLPPAVKLSLHACATFTEASCTEMCVHAVQPVSVWVPGHRDVAAWQEGWQQRVQTAMAAVGHQHVTLQSRIPITALRMDSDNEV